ncbi:hypothetical protein PCE1_001971 [Barthelona sp. PCE]
MNISLVAPFIILLAVSTASALPFMMTKSTVTVETESPGLDTSPDIIDLNSTVGQTFFKQLKSHYHYNHIHKFYRPQLKNHCGIATAVIGMNTLLNADVWTQKSIFTQDVTRFLNESTVYKQGMTLDNLFKVIAAVSDIPQMERMVFQPKKMMDVFQRDVKRFYSNSFMSGLMAINLNRKTLWGAGGGHFLLVASEINEHGYILLHEVSATRPSFFVKVESLVYSMSTPDSVSLLPRGWISLLNA